MEYPKSSKNIGENNSETTAVIFATYVTEHNTTKHRWTHRSVVFRWTVALPHGRGPNTGSLIGTKPCRDCFSRGLTVILCLKFTGETDKVSGTIAIVRSFGGRRTQGIVFTSVTVRTGSKQVCHLYVGSRIVVCFVMLCVERSKWMRKMR